MYIAKTQFYTHYPYLGGTLATENLIKTKSHGKNRPNSIRDKISNVKIMRAVNLSNRLLYKIRSRNDANMWKIGQKYFSIIPSVTLGTIPFVTLGMMLIYFWPTSHILASFRLWILYRWRASNQNFEIFSRFLSIQIPTTSPKKPVFSQKF